MTEPVVPPPVEHEVRTPRPAIFNFNAYSPAEIEEAIEKVGVTKAALPLLPCLMLAVIAGGAIGLGALYYSVVVSDATLSFRHWSRARRTRLLSGTVDRGGRWR
jgi:hypothetical protein